MSLIWVIIIIFSVVYSFLSGNMDALSSGVFEGASAGVSLCISICGITCLWSGIMEIMEQSGMAAALSALFRPLLSVLYPENKNNPAAMKAVSANISANLLGLGNAATPLGMQAAAAMQNGSDEASDDMCTLVVMNTASIQLLPTTVAGIRAAAGSAAPFDILPPVWLSSILSVSAGIISARVMSKLWRKRA